MATAARWSGLKRQPLSVKDLGDDRYEIVDGNSTYHALLELGEHQAVVEIM